MTQAANGRNPSTENKHSSISFDLEEVGDFSEAIGKRRPSMMNTMTNKMRRFSEISVEFGRDQSVRGLAIVLIVAILFVIAIYCFDWLGVYLVLFEFFRPDQQQLH